MSVFDDLKKLSSAEDFFAYLQVDYDPAVLCVARLHILRRMGERLHALVGDEAELWSMCRAHLASAYEEFVRHAPIEQRVFKVLREATSAARLGLVRLRTPEAGPLPERR